MVTILARIMSITPKLKWFGRFAGPGLGAFCLLEYCAVVHYMALSRIETSLRGYVVDPKMARRVALIDLIQNNGWIVGFYALVFFGMLWWLGRRSMPKWTVWMCFASLSLPCLAYGWGCFAVWQR